jgi:hypothetical protein
LRARFGYRRTIAATPAGHSVVVVADEATDEATDDGAQIERPGRVS